MPPGGSRGANCIRGDMDLLIQCTIQEGDHLGTVADAIDAEGAVAHAVGDVVLHGPCHGGGVELVGLHVSEADLGMGDGTFGVNGICNRAQVVTFLYRALKK